VLKAYATYTAAVAVGIFAPLFVLWAARTAPLGASPALVTISVVAALAFASALFASLLPRRWIITTSMVSVPIALLGCVMFFALTESGAAYYIWLVVGIGSLASSAGAAFFGAKVVLRLQSRPASAPERATQAQREP
jgi:hypothetical protein